jgi:hypothetical protein
MPRKKADTNGDRPEPKSADEPKQPEPHEINTSLDSPRMRALLEDHRKMGSRQ